MKEHAQDLDTDLRFRRDYMTTNCPQKHWAETCLAVGGHYDHQYKVICSRRLSVNNHYCTERWVGDYSGVLTNSSEAFLEFCTQNFNEKIIVFTDLEASYYMSSFLVSCITVVHQKRFIICHGPEASQAVALWAILSHANGITNLVWDAGMESTYLPNCTDL